jgi:hypothetical protein
MKHESKLSPFDQVRKYPKIVLESTTPSFKDCITLN